MTKLIVQIGWCKSFKEVQTISAWHNDKLVNWDKTGDAYAGVFLTQAADRRHKIWYLAPIEAEDGDTVRIKTWVGMYGKGLDEARTQELLYVVDTTKPGAEARLHRIGDTRYPVLAGAFRTVSASNLTHQREAEALGFLETVGK